jgi:hypothetical protein
MRILAAAVSCLLVVLAATLGVCDEPAKKSDISIAVPSQCSSVGFSCECKGLYLYGSYEAGLDVVLLGKAGVFCTKPDSTCASNPIHPTNTLTHSADTEKYGEFPRRQLFQHANVVVVGADPAEVRLVPVNPETSPLPDKMEQEARRLAAASMRKPREHGYGTIFESSPTIILRAGNATLLSFEPEDRSNRSPGEHGLLVLFINDKGYRLPGEHFGTLDPFFFSVKDKLYLAYNIPWVSLHTLVYDLSGETPKEVFPRPRPNPATR